MTQAKANSATEKFSVPKLKDLMASSPGLKLLDPSKLKILENAVAKGKIDIMQKLFALLENEREKLDAIDTDFKKQSKVLFDKYTKTLKNLNSNLLKITERKNSKSDNKAADELLSQLKDI